MFKIMRENHGSHIAVDLSSRRLHFSEGSRLVKTYPVGVGKPSTPTPVGSYKVITKIMNPGGALGTRWMGLSIPGGNYGIHGTNNPSSIGGYVSNGCIRMYNKDVEEIFPLVQIGTAVDIYKKSDKFELPSPHFHVVQAGETLWEIARMYGKPLEAILMANQIINPGDIHPGQKIMIPAII